MMEDLDSLFGSPSEGSSLFESFCEQDFCYGAKSLTSQVAPGFLTPPGYAFFRDSVDEVPGWMEIRNSFDDYSSFDAFSDVIIPESSLDPISLFDDLGITPSLEQTSTAAVNKLGETPQIILKLKRVKHSKNRKQFFVEDPVELKTLQQPLLSQRVNSESACPSSLSEIMLIEDIANFQPESPDVNKANLTLLDAIDTGQADDLLDRILSPNGSASGNESIEITLDDCEILSQGYHSPFQSESGMSLNSPQSSPGSLGILSPASWNEWETTTNIQLGSSPNFSLDDEYRPSNKKGKASSRQARTEDRYLRKKHQNKRAALKYRIKKKKEEDSLVKSLRKEEELKDKLQKKRSQLQKEISFTRQLLREAFIAKKLVPKEAFICGFKNEI